MDNPVTSPRCRLCQGTVVARFELPVLGRIPVTYWECQGCGSLQTDEPTWLEEAYSKDNLALDVGIVQRTMNLAMKVPILVQALGAAGARALDWGGGNGLFSRMMRDRGLDFRCHDRYVESFYTRPFTADPTRDGPFPVVTCFEVLEHLPNPARDIAEILATDCDVLVASTELYSGQGPDWWYLSPEHGEHVFFYSPRALALVAERFGYRAILGADIHVFLREKPRHLAYGATEIAHLEGLLRSPATLLEEGLRHHIAHQFNPWEAIQRDSETVKRMLAGTPEPAPAAPSVARRAGPTVVLDGVFFQRFDTGIARVWREIMREWDESGFAANVVLLDRNRTAPPFPGGNTRVAAPHDYEQFEVQRDYVQACCDRVGAHAFTSTYYTAPLTTPSVLMVYDMIPEVLGFDLSEPMWREKHAAIGYASRFVCISENTRADLERLFPAARGRSRVAYPAVAQAFRPLPRAEVEPVLAQYGLDRPYFMAVGVTDGYKNGRALLAAFEWVRSQGPDLLLVCTGALNRMLTTTGVDPSRLRILKVPDDQLAALYNGSAGLVFPSLYEGFGLPLVEAMRCGCPVVASDVQVMREVAGEAAVYVAPHDPTSIGRGMLAALDPELRPRLAAAGRSRAERYSWREIAEAMRVELEAVAEGSLVGSGA